MDLKNIPMYQMMNNKLTWLSQRQKLIAQNIANATTPGYKEVDLEKASFKELLTQSTSATSTNNVRLSDAKHLSGVGGSRQSNFTIVENRNSADEKINGNTVSIEEQMLKLTETSGMDRELKTLMKKQVQFIKMALRGGQ